jgi:hypothetical protein
MIGYILWFGLEKGTPTQCLDFPDYMRTLPVPVLKVMR